MTNPKRRRFTIYCQTPLCEGHKLTVDEFEHERASNRPFQKKPFQNRSHIPRRGWGFTYRWMKWARASGLFTDDGELRTNVEGKRVPWAELPLPPWASGPSAPPKGEQ